MPRRKPAAQNIRLAAAANSALEFRRQIAHLAAKLIADEGLTDYAAAKLKAARSLGVDTREELPDNREIEAAVREHLAIFQQATQPSELRELRKLAVFIMRRLLRFSPLLCGAVATGTANRFSNIELHILVSEEKALDLFLMNENIDYSIGVTGNQHDGQKTLLYEFTVHNVQVSAAVFMTEAEWSRSATTNAARKRGLEVAELEQLLRTT